MKFTKTETLYSGRFLELKRIMAEREDGTELQWECAQRRTPSSPVVIIPRIRQTLELVLVRQFRIPLSRWCLEFPAGIRDVKPDGSLETPEETAVRELWEETGYRGTVKLVFPEAASSAGLTGETVIPVSMDIDLDQPDNQLPQAGQCQGVDATERIEVLRIDPSLFHQRVSKMVRAGTVADSRLMFWSIGRES